MATATARAVQRAEAVQRLTEQTAVVADALGIAAPDIPTSHRDPSYVPTLQLEAVADFLANVSTALKGVEVIAKEIGAEMDRLRTEAELAKADAASARVETKQAAAKGARKPKAAD